MSKWAQAKQIVDLDWRAEWREVAQGTMGELDAVTLQEALAIVNQMDDAYHCQDKAGFLVLKDQLVKHPSWTGSINTCGINPAVGSEKPTAAPTVLALPI